MGGLRSKYVEEGIPGQLKLKGIAMSPQTKTQQNVYHKEIL